MSKQIEEMARELAENLAWDEDEIPTVDCLETAKRLYVEGYRKQNEWIPVTERLPENDYGNHWKNRRSYLVYEEPTRLMHVATFGYKEYPWWIGGGVVLDDENHKKVTHWMPLPLPPETEKGGAE